MMIFLLYLAETKELNIQWTYSLTDLVAHFTLFGFEEYIGNV